MSRLALVLLALVALPGRARADVTLVVKNLDLPGQGFNDPTPAAPVGGNPGTTLGEQRLATFNRAAQVWGRALVGRLPIEIDANFAPLPCTGGEIVLGHARPTTFVASVRGLPAGSWFPVALANQLVDRDLAPGESEIEATFNGDLSGCSGGKQDWYYGFDGNAGDRNDLLHVVLHELGHGLGFMSLINPRTGELPQGRTDPYSRHLVDGTTGLAWSGMTDLQRMASARRPRKLAWDGMNVARQMAQLLPLGAPVLRTTPALPGLAGQVAEAEFGRYLSEGAVSGPLQLGTLSTSTCDFEGTAAGAVVLLSQIVCAPILQAYNAQRAGAVAILQVDPEDRSPPLSVDTQPSDRSRYPVTIPVLALSPDEAQILAAAAPGTTVQLSADAAVRVGGDRNGRTLLFASDPLLQSSTVSHWEVLARPNLLMEAYLPPDPVHDLRMELALFRDLGWATTCGNGTMDAGEDCDQGAQNGAAGATCRADCSLAGSGGTGGSTGGPAMDVPLPADGGGVVGGDASAPGAGGPVTTPEEAATLAAHGCVCQAGRRSGTGGPGFLVLAAVLVLVRRRTRTSAR